MFTGRKLSTLSERAGVLLGRLIAPVFTLTTRARRARTFHPRGDLAFGEVAIEPDVATQDLPLALALSGNVLARFSSALFRGVRWPDLLGCALRFERAGAGVQDLLFATIKRPWTMPFAPFTTRVADYFANDYFAVSPFSTPFSITGSRVYFRLHTAASADEDGHGKPNDRSFLRQRSFFLRDMTHARRGSLARAIADGTAALELAVADGPRGPWRPCVRVRLTALLLAAEPARLAFDPFQSARGIEPIGFVHALRRGVYEASRAARGASAADVRATMTLPRTIPGTTHAPSALRRNTS